MEEITFPHIGSKRHRNLVLSGYFLILGLLSASVSSAQTAFVALILAGLISRDTVRRLEQLKVLGTQSLRYSSTWQFIEQESVIEARLVPEQTFIYQNFMMIHFRLQHQSRVLLLFRAELGDFGFRRLSAYLRFGQSPKSALANGLSKI